MLKKIIGLSFMCLVLFSLIACEYIETEETSIQTDIPSTPIIEQPTMKTYELSKDTFESFFGIQATLIPLEKHYEVDFKIRDLHMSQTRNANFSVTLYVEYTDQFATKTMTYQIDGRVSGKLFEYKMPMQHIEIGMNPRILYRELNIASGSYVGPSNIEIKQKTYTPPQIDHDVISIDDLTENQRIMDLWQKKLDTLDQYSDSDIVYDVISNNIISTMRGSTIEKITNTIKFSPSHQYLEISVDGQTTLFKMIDTRLFGYKLNDNKEGIFYINPFVVEDGDLSAYYEGRLLVNLGDFSPYQYDYHNIKFSETAQGFKLQGYIKDFMNEDEYQYFRAIYQSLGATDTELQNVVLTIDYKFAYNTVDIISDFNINIHRNGINHLSSQTYEKITFKNVYVRDLTDTSKYYVYMPNNMNEVIEETDLSQLVVQPFSPKPDYYLTYFEKGPYVLNAPDNEVTAKIYNQVGEEVMHEATNVIDIEGNTFYIPEDGYYYVKISSNNFHSSDGYEFNFEMAKEIAGLFGNSPEVLNDGMHEIILQSEHDIKAYVIQSETPVVLKIDYTNASYDIEVVYRKSRLQIISNVWQNNETYLIHFPAGENTIYFRAEQALSGQINVQSFDIDKHRMEPYQAVSDEYEGDYIVISEYLEPAYMTMELLEQSVVTFEFDEEGISNSFVSFAIYDMQGNLKTNGNIHEGYDSILLNEGSYILKIISSKAAVTRLKRTLIQYQPIEIMFIELETVNTLHNDSDIPIIKFKHYTREQIKQAWFTLEEAQTIFIGVSRFYALFNEHGERLSFYQFDIHTGTRGYYYLDAGTYYIEHYNDMFNGAWTYDVKIAIIEGGIKDDNKEGSSISVFDFGTHQLNKDHDYDQEIIKFEVLTECNCQISSDQYYYIFNIDNEIIKGRSKGESTIKLKPGIYYIWMPFYSGSSNWNFSIN